MTPSVARKGSVRVTFKGKKIVLKPTEAVQLLGVGNLNWNEDESKYDLLSFFETREIVDRCVDCGIKETEDIMVVIRAYEDSIASQILFRNFINGELKARIENNEIYWAKN